MKIDESHKMLSSVRSQTKKYIYYMVPLNKILKTGQNTVLDWGKRESMHNDVIERDEYVI